MVKTNQKLTIYNEEDFEKLKELSTKVSKSRAIKLISELSTLENNMKQSTQRIIVFQAGIIKLCDREISEKQENSSSNVSGNGNADIYARLEKIENYLRAGGGVARTQAPVTGNRKTATTGTKSTTQSNSTDAIAGIGKDKKPAQYWQQVVNNFKQNGKIMLKVQAWKMPDIMEGNSLVIIISEPKRLRGLAKSWQH